MKKILVRVAMALVVLVILGVLAVSLFLNSGVKRGIEIFGPQLTKVSVKLDNVSISMLSGSGSVKGLTVGNPEGYKTPQAISVGSAMLTLKPLSVLGDKLVINKIEVLSPEITFEGGFAGNNLSKILSNLEDSTRSSDTNAPPGQKGEGPSRKLQVDDFAIKSAKVNVSITGMNGKTLAVVIPDIHLTELGTGPEGITAAELTKRVLKALEQATMKAAEGAMAGLGNNATELTKDLGKRAGGSLTNVTKGLGDLFKKK